MKEYLFKNNIGLAGLVAWLSKKPRSNHPPLEGGSKPARLRGGVAWGFNEEFTKIACAQSAKTPSQVALLFDPPSRGG